jgi:hypothetical protein
VEVVSVVAVLSLLVLSAVVSDPLHEDKKSNTAAKKDMDKIRVDFIVLFLNS